MQHIEHKIQPNMVVPSSFHIIHRGTPKIMSFLACTRRQYVT